jgi:hypothetical protein
MTLQLNRSWQGVVCAAVAGLQQANQSDWQAHYLVNKTRIWAKATDTTGF